VSEALAKLGAEHTEALLLQTFNSMHVPIPAIAGLEYMRARLAEQKAYDRFVKDELTRPNGRKRAPAKARS
jgi:hypothetical protein